jgi:hypothetical protein
MPVPLPPTCRFLEKFSKHIVFLKIVSILVFDPEFGIDLLARTGFFGMGYGRIFGIRDGIDSRDFRDGI